MRKNSHLINTLLIAIVLSLAGTSALRLYPLTYDFDTVEIATVIRDRHDSTGKRFDTVLLKNLKSFAYIRSFDHVLKRGERTVNIQRPLYIDRCEVRQGDFYKFARWQQLVKKKNIAAPTQPIQWRYESNTRKHLISGKTNAPANGVTYYDAYAYCRAAGGRLPFETEWIAAAAGKQNRLYPWGDTFQTEGLPYLDPLLNAAQKCKAHKEIATPKRIYGMAGNNVSEWATNSDTPLEPAIVGGNAFNDPREVYNLNVFYRTAPPSYRSPYVGFRCVYNRKIKRTPWRIPINTAKIGRGSYSVGIPEDSRISIFLAKLPRKQIDTIERIFNQQKTSGETSLHVMRYEVTRQQYDHFLNDWFAKLGLYGDENQPQEHSYRPPDWAQQMQKPVQPVTNIDWWSAYAFAKWAGGRLLSAEEWAIIASNRGKYIYPWGNQMYNEASPSGLQAPGSNPIDVTLKQIADMGGNVSEWTQSVTTVDGSYAIITKGGNYLFPTEQTARVDFNNYVSPHYRSPILGFRVVFDLPR